MNNITTTPSWRLLLLPLVGGLLAQTAHAVPSFARQTGMACEACHTMYPELTDFGRAFKMNGYTITGMQQVESKGGDSSAALKINEIPPLSLMLQTSVSRVANVDKNVTTGGVTTNGPVAQQISAQFPQQLSLFFAGEISPHMGSFLQMTYNHQTDHFTQDQSEIRYANQGMLGGQNVTYGLTLNNTPTMEDPWQGTPDWGFPYNTPGSALPSPAATPFLNNTLGQSVVGLGGYMHINNHWYVDVTGYRSEQAKVGQPYTPSATGIIDGLAPYWRVAYDTDLSTGYLEFGAYGMMINQIPTGISGPSNHRVDNAIDGQYELPMGNNELIVRGTYITEKDTWRAAAVGTVSNPSDTLNFLNLNASFHFANQQEVSLGIIRTTGSSDVAYYNTTTVAPEVAYGNPNVLSGDVSGNPASTAWVAQYEFLPWQNVQLGVQYTAYTKFNGATNNYDGMGRNASDNNTAMIYGWFMW